VGLMNFTRLYEFVMRNILIDFYIVGIININLDKINKGE
jgi:hypothetical protein